MSEINVVPYIDVMLVLLVIFMATAPLLTQGVIVDLPDAPSDVTKKCRVVKDPGFSPMLKPGGNEPAPGASAVSARHAAREVPKSGRTSPDCDPPSRVAAAATSALAMPVSAASNAFCAIC